MAILTDIHSLLGRLGARECLNVDADQLLPAMRTLGDEVVEVMADAAAVRTALERFMTVGAAVIAERSARELGHGGLAAIQGHRTPAALVQSITGSTMAEASRVVRLGESLLDGAGESSPDSAEPVLVPWHDGLRQAMMRGDVSPAAHDAILRGLGEPPSADLHEVWARAAEVLRADAATMSAEQLLARARQERDLLDPIGAEERFARRYDDRAFRRYTNKHGQPCATIVFEDEGAARFDAMTDAALRPRRGGPRFMTDAERAQAASLVADRRTNEQLVYDLVMDVLHAGSLASASDVFGARQAGVRLVVVKDAIGPRDPIGRLMAGGNLEDGGDAMPGSVIDRMLCDVGTIEVMVDSCGNPLDVGREKRLFTAAQRLALAVRDGGCMWPGCPMPPSYCEAHHIDHWDAEHGRTDIDRGLLLCRFHHLLLHNNGWKVQREGQGVFVLRRPDGGEPIELSSKSAVRWAWNPPSSGKPPGSWRVA